MITSSDLCALVCRLCIPAPCVDSLDGLCGQLTVKPVVICVDRLLFDCPHRRFHVANPA